jgi:hypothetical protein
MHADHVVYASGDVSGRFWMMTANGRIFGERLSD